MLERALVIRLSLSRRLVDLSPVAQRTNAVKYYSYVFLWKLVCCDTLKIDFSALQRGVVLFSLFLFMFLGAPRLR